MIYNSYDDTQYRESRRQNYTDAYLFLVIFKCDSPCYIIKNRKYGVHILLQICCALINYYLVIRDRSFNIVSTYLCIERDKFNLKQDIHAQT